MALFNFGKKKEPVQKPTPKPDLLWSRTFTQSNSFKGFRRITLSTFKIEGVNETLSYFHDIGNDFKGRTIRLDHVKAYDVFTDGPAYFINVYVDNMPIGTVYGTNEQRYPMLTEYEYDKVYIRVENGKVYLFVHYPAEAPIKVTVE